MNNHEEYNGGKKTSRHNGNEDDYDSSDSYSDENSQEDRNSNHNQNYQNHENQQRHGDNRRSDTNYNNNNHDHKNNNNNHDNRNQQRNVFSERSQPFAPYNPGQIQPLGDYSGNSWPHQNNGMRVVSNGNKSRDIDNQNSTSKNNNKDHDSCMVLCFFKEMKMVNALRVQNVRIYTNNNIYKCCRQIATDFRIATKCYKL